MYWGTIDHARFNSVNSHLPFTSRSLDTIRTVDYKKIFVFKIYACEKSILPHTNTYI